LAQLALQFSTRDGAGCRRFGSPDSGVTAARAGILPGADDATGFNNQPTLNGSTTY
jgi:hypothetical protein